MPGKVRTIIAGTLLGIYTLCGTGCAAGWFLAGAGTVAAAGMFMAEEEKKNKAEAVEEDVYDTEEEYEYK